MIFKSYIIEENFETIHNCKLFLFYGENQGLKQEFKEKLKKQNKTKEILNLFQDEIIKNKNILINEIKNKSLLSNCFAQSEALMQGRSLEEVYLS